MNDTLRLLLDRTLIAAKKEQADSGFIARKEKISIYDNFLFCLSLFRSKTHENVLEAKKLLDRLLYFQQGFSEIASLGNYPLYLSDYPYCNDHLQALRCLAVKVWILREFSQILGAELKARLELSMQKLMQFLVGINKEVKFPFWAKCKLASCAAFMNLSIEMPDLHNTSDLRCWGDPQALAELIVAYQLMPSDKWAPFWNYLSSTWHEPSKQYVGPAYKLGFQHPHLQAALALFSGSLDALNTYPLFCAMLTVQNELQQNVFPTHLKGANDRFSWSVHHFAEYAYSTLLGKQSPEQMPGFFPYYLAAGPHSLAIQAPFGYATSELVFEIEPEVYAEDKEKAKALVISFNDHPHNNVLVSGQKATCFTFSDPLEITLGKKTLKLSFERLSGDGQFVGHIVRGNRSGHCQERYTASDVQIFLRALRGTTATVIKVNLALE